MCIAGVADQLQTNFAADLRRILRIVFTINIDSLNDTDKKVMDEIEPGELPIVLSTSLDRREDYVEQDEINDVSEGTFDDEQLENTSCFESSPNSATQSDIQQIGSADLHSNSPTSRMQHTNDCVLQAPKWIPDNDAPLCMNCAVPFHSFFRRRHHCRNCGGVFCNICSSLCTPLPKYGLYKAVRVCKDCFTSEARNSK